MMLSLILVMLCAGVLNAATKNVPAEQPTIQAGADDPSDSRSLRDFLKPDGSVDFDAVRLSGHEGSLDLRGLDVGLDPATGAPRVQSPAVPSHPDDQYWHDLSDKDVGTNSALFAVTLYNGDLIVGGAFTTAGGVSANYIARWDGAAWQPLGSGMNYKVRALTVYNEELIAAGMFTTAGGVTVNYIARWDGAAWQPLGSGMSGWVWSLTVYDGELIAGGKFSTAGGILVGHVARCR
jgi:hypothetical protein